MTDTTDWTADSGPGTILMFRFPNAETGLPGKARPCLVIAVNNDVHTPRLTLAYGTTAITEANRGLDLAVATRADRAAAGLHHPTRFVLSRRITIDAADPRLDHGADGHPVIGRLAANSQPQLAALIRAIGPSVAVDQLRGLPPQRPPNGSERRRICLRRRRSHATRPVIVEHRRPRPRRSRRSDPAA